MNTENEKKNTCKKEKIAAATGAGISAAAIAAAGIATTMGDNVNTEQAEEPVSANIPEKGQGKPLKSDIPAENNAFVQNVTDEADKQHSQSDDILDEMPDSASDEDVLIAEITYDNEEMPDETLISEETDEEHIAENNVEEQSYEVDEDEVLEENPAEDLALENIISDEELVADIEEQLSEELADDFGGDFIDSADNTLMDGSDDYMAHRSILDEDVPLYSEIPDTDIESDIHNLV